MFGEHFYHKTIRNTVIAFGTIFNNINIKRLDSSGNPLQNIRVPLSYSPKEKFLARLDAQQDLTGDDSKVAITLPRMSFEITGYTYDASRKLNKNQKMAKVKTSGDTEKLNTQYVPVPYDISFQLNVFTATQDDGLQILEQILPVFQPHYNLSIKLVPSMGETKDVPIVLTNIDYEDSYEGDFATRRAIIYTLQFTAKTFLYGPVTESKIIKKANVDYYTSVDTAKAPREVRYQATPTSLQDRDGVVVTTLSAATDTNDNLIAVADASGITKFDSIYIDNELIRVQKISGNNLTVLRAYEGTTAAAHTNGSSVFLVNQADADLLDGFDDFGFGELKAEFTDMKKKNFVSGNDEAI